MITTTLNRIKKHSPCKAGWEKLLRYLGKTKADDEILPYSLIVESNGIEDALWCCLAEPQHAKEWRLYAVWCARQVQHLMDDKRSVEALNVAERHANGQADDKELASASDAARAAAWDAAMDADRASASAAASAAAWAAAWASASASASAAASSAAWAAAMAADRAAQTKRFLEIVNGLGAI